MNGFIPLLFALVLLYSSLLPYRRLLAASFPRFEQCLNTAAHFRWLNGLVLLMLTVLMLVEVAGWPGFFRGAPASFVVHVAAISAALVLGVLHAGRLLIVTGLLAEERAAAVRGITMRVKQSAAAAGLPAAFWIIFVNLILKLWF